MISANELRKLQLTVTEQGYSVDEVNAVINEASTTIDAYVNENKELYHKLEVLASKIEEYRAEEDSIKTALLTAQKMADRITKESKDESEKLLADSKAAASHMVDDANTKADRIVSEARDYSASMLREKTEEANAVLADAEKKSNDAISSAKIVAQNILDQAKEISDDLISKSKEEQEAYESLNTSLRKNAAGFIENLKSLYSGQLEALGAVKLFGYDEEKPDTSEISSIKDDVNSLVNEIEEMQQAIPEEIKIDKPEIEEPEYAVASDEEIEELLTGSEEETIDEPAEEIIEENEEEIIEEIPVAEEEETDIVSAVEAFSADKITPIDRSRTYVPEINEEPEMEKSLFEEKAPFEEYFHVKTKDAHLDKTQTISLIPPEDDDDDEPKFKGFFKKKR